MLSTIEGANRQNRDNRTGSLNLCAAITTTGRRELLEATLPHFQNQTRRPDTFFISVADEADVDVEAVASLPFEVKIIRGPKGLCRQRNRVLDAAADADVIMFLDDDFLPQPSFFERVEKLFRSRDDVVVATGRVLADGIGGPGLSVEDGLAALAGDPDPDEAGIAETYGAYGCNMLVRASVARRHAVRFDERLPAYGWLEDIDFSRRLARHGKVVRDHGLRGVHLGHKSGRSPGRRLGYSQVANPLYLVGKGAISRRFAWKYMSRNLAANLVKAARPEPWVDRRGRLSGNLIALRDLVTGALDPERIERL